MKKHLAIFVCLFIFGFMPLAAHALDLSSVRFGQHDNKVRMVVEMSASSDFLAFVIDNPYRIVVDLPSFNWAAGKVSHPGFAGITGIRHGALKSGVSRVVIDVNRPISIQSAFVLPAASGKPNRLVIDFSKSNAGSFNQEKGRVFGTLDTNNPKAPVPAVNTRIAGTVPSTVSPPKVSSVIEKPLIVIDPGHGGVDPGAISKATGLHEKNIVLALAKVLRDELAGTGRYNVVMTRDDDRFIKLHDRVKFARSHSADLFVSIHADAVENSSTRGASVYTLSEKASDAQTAKLAARENKVDLIAGIDLSVEDQEVVDILVDLARRDTMNQSKFFAGKLVNVLPNHGVGMLVNPHRYAGFAVLKAPDIPSVLIESGFVSNSSEARKLNSNAFRRKFAVAMRQGIDAYFEQVRKNARE
ncbi:MAG: N-acetylmuramoyl-L-alanine amidase [Micavibrio sp.]|nr:N-acetylmuramoyl-L-alanine amidase [Micavibrio sp.]